MIFRVDPFTSQSKPCLKLLDNAKRSKVTFISLHIIANQNSYYDDKSTWQCFTCFFCPWLIRNVRSRRHFDSSSIIAHPVNFEIVKMWCQELDIYIYLPLGNRYGFFSSTWDYTTFQSFFFFFFFNVEKKKKHFPKVGRSVIGWRSG